MESTGTAHPAEQAGSAFQGEDGDNIYVCLAILYYLSFDNHIINHFAHIEYGIQISALSLLFLFLYNK